MTSWPRSSARITKDWVMILLLCFARRRSGDLSELRSAGGIADEHHFKLGLGRAAIGADPIRGHVGPAGSRRNAVFRQAKGFVIGESASQADPAFEGLRHINLPRHSNA